MHYIKVKVFTKSYLLSLTKKITFDRYFNNYFKYESLLLKNS